MIKSLIFLLIIANIEIITSLEAEKKFIYDVENPFDKDNNMNLLLNIMVLMNLHIIF